VCTKASTQLQYSLYCPVQCASPVVSFSMRLMQAWYSDHFGIQLLWAFSSRLLLRGQPTHDSDIFSWWWWWWWWWCEREGNACFLFSFWWRILLLEEKRFRGQSFVVVPRQFSSGWVFVSNQRTTKNKNCPLQPTNLLGSCQSMNFLPSAPPYFQVAAKMIGRNPVNLIVGWCGRFYFLLPLIIFH